LRWLEIVKPIINVNWDDLKKANILDSDFYLADLLVDDRDTLMIDDDHSIRDSLFIVFQNEGYKIAKEDIKQMFDALKLKCRQACIGKTMKITLGLKYELVGGKTLPK
jgi:hypothetical protein